MQYFVKATYRLNHCDSSSRIVGLVLDQPFNGFTVHELGNLVELARQGNLLVNVGAYYPRVHVRIEWSHQYGHWVARTDADSVTSNNLLRLPIVYPARSQGNTTTYEACSI